MINEGAYMMTQQIKCDQRWQYVGQNVAMIDERTYSYLT